MKLRNFANKFLLLIALVLVLSCSFTLGTTPVNLRIVTAEAEETAATALTKTYLYDQLNWNKPSDTPETIYDALGIKTYNNYLMELSQTQELNEVIVAVVDSGVDRTQSVFDDRLLSDYAMDFSRGLPSADTNTWYVDENGHGTHVSGIIADATLANVKILPVKIFYGTSNESNNYYYSFLNALRYLYALKTGKKVSLVNNVGVESATYGYYFNPEEVQLENLVVVNMSLGTEGLTKEELENKYSAQRKVYQEMIDYYLLQNNILPIVAAGNRETEKEKELDENGELKPYYSIPGACSGILAVAAYDNRNQKYALADFSYYNDNISIAAPGAEIWSACTNKISAIKTKLDIKEDGIYYTYGTLEWKKDLYGNYYYKSSGTSMATPFVTACYAMLMSDYSKTQAADFGLTSWNHDNVESSDHQYLTMAHKALLAAAATNGVGTAGYSEKFGYGTLTVACFVPEHGTTTIEPLNEIEYEPVVNTTKDTAQEPEVVFLGKTSTQVNWFLVCVILAVGIVAIWLIKIFRDYCAAMIRRKEEANDEQ
ncbi:MAG: S8/S53 family peptidase [Eubacteriales bacterium]|nr:S8/S53 family peptidase [Eubacteriales bacterium]